MLGWDASAFVETVYVGSWEFLSLDRVIGEERKLLTQRRQSELLQNRNLGN